MTTKWKRREARRHNQDEISAQLQEGSESHPSSPEQLPPAERRAAGEIVGALLNAITFGALEPAPPSHAR